ncbi:MAG: hypothetical protein BRC26_00860 [Nanohaloarchaea archaeon QH_8_44_6]|nr:MAG: hypothetical protein BRC26_00860 [Nanohaloarchaea archaeon QH_8_44_6]
MIRHRKEERRRNPGFNTTSWKTEKSIDEVYNSLIDPDTAIEYTFPYQIEITTKVEKPSSYQNPVSIRSTPTVTVMSGKVRKSI